MSYKHHFTSFSGNTATIFNQLLTISTVYHVNSIWYIRTTTFDAFWQVTLSGTSRYHPSLWPYLLPPDLPKFVHHYDPWSVSDNVFTSATVLHPVHTPIYDLQPGSNQINSLLRYSNNPTVSSQSPQVPFHFVWWKYHYNHQPATDSANVFTCTIVSSSTNTKYPPLLLSVSSQP